MLLFLALALQAAPASPSITGFSCYGYGEKKPSTFLNISLDSQSWQSGDDGGWHKISSVAPTKIWLINETSNSGVSRVFTLDRRSLILVESMFFGTTQQLVEVKWACKLGPPIDLTAGRQF